MGATVTGLALVGQAQANELRRPALKLSVDAPCTDEATFGSRLRGRTSGPIAGDGEEGIPVSIRIRASGRSVEGTMTTRSASSEGESIRRVEGATCDEVADALVFVVVTTFDPDADAEASAPSEHASHESSTPLAPAPPARRTARVAAADAPRPVSRTERLQWQAGAQTTLAVSDRVPRGVTLFAEVGRATGGTKFRVGFGAMTASVHDARRSARLLWTSLMPELCPLAVDAGALTVSPCGGISLGVFASGLVHADYGRAYARPWIAPRAVARGRFALTRRFSFEAQIAAEIPILRDRVRFEGERVYTSPRVMTSIALGIGLELD